MIVCNYTIICIYLAKTTFCNDILFILLAYICTILAIYVKI